MTSQRKHHAERTAPIAQLGHAALGALASAMILTLLTSCSPTEPAAPRPPSMPSEADAPPHPVSENDTSAHGDFEIKIIGPEWAKREYERMDKIMQETKPGGCDPPPLLSFGTCEGVGTCDTFPFLARTEAPVVRVDVMDSGQEPGNPDLPTRGSELRVEVIHCGAVPTTIMTRSQDYVTSSSQPLSFSVPMEVKEKYFLRISNNKLPALQVNTSYAVSDPQPACDDSPPEAAR